MLKFSILLHRALQGMDEQQVYDLCLSQGLICKQDVDMYIFPALEQPMQIPQNLVNSLTMLGKPSLTMENIVEALLYDQCEIVRPYIFLTALGDNITFYERLSRIFQLLFSGKTLLQMMRIIDAPLSFFESILGYDLSHFVPTEEKYAMQVSNVKYILNYISKAHSVNNDVLSDLEVYQLLLIESPKMTVQDSYHIKYYNLQEDYGEEVKSLYLDCCQWLYYRNTNENKEIAGTLHSIYMSRLLDSLNIQNLLENTFFLQSDIDNLLTSQPVPLYIFKSLLDYAPYLNEQKLKDFLAHNDIGIVKSTIGLETTYGKYVYLDREYVYEGMDIYQTIQACLPSLDFKTLGEKFVRNNLTELVRFFRGKNFDVLNLFDELILLKKHSYLKYCPFMIMQNFPLPEEDDPSYSFIKAFHSIAWYDANHEHWGESSTSLVRMNVERCEWHISNLYKEMYEEVRSLGPSIMPEPLSKFVKSRHGDPLYAEQFEKLREIVKSWRREYANSLVYGKFQTPLASEFGAYCYIYESLHRLLDETLIMQQSI